MTAPSLSQTSSTASLGAPEQPKPKNAAEAAKQFEALMIAQMMRSARESVSSGEHDSTGETMFDLAGQQFAQMLANNGGFGLAKMIAAGLKSKD
jgi:Rod binding domain-containing protein